jgi:hypothetical protein
VSGLGRSRSVPSRAALRAALLLVAAGVLAGCSGKPSTNLTIEVANGFGHQEFRLKCDPNGGDVPHPKDLCALLDARSDVMLLRPADGSTCAGGVGTVHLQAHGDFDGSKVDATEIDACQGNVEAERLWLSQLPPPTGS